MTKDNNLNNRNITHNIKVITKMPRKEFIPISIPKEFIIKIKEIINKTGLYLNVADFVREATRLRAEELLKQIEQKNIKEAESLKIPQM